MRMLVKLAWTTRKEIEGKLIMYTKRRRPVAHHLLHIRSKSPRGVDHLGSPPNFYSLIWPLSIMESRPPNLVLSSIISDLDPPTRESTTPSTNRATAATLLVRKRANMEKDKPAREFIKVWRNEGAKYDMRRKNSTNWSIKVWNSKEENMVIKEEGVKYNQRNIYGKPSRPKNYGRLTE